MPWLKALDSLCLPGRGDHVTHGPMQHKQKSLSEATLPKQRGSLVR